VVDSDLAQLSALAVGRMDAPALRIAVRMRGTARDARPFGPRPRSHQPEIDGGAVRGLQVVGAAEAARAQALAQRHPTAEIEKARPAVDPDLVEIAAHAGELDERLGGEQRDMGALVVPPNRRARSE